MRVYPFTRSEDATLDGTPFLSDEIPPCLLNFLGTAQKQNSRYHDVYDSRERRLRLLLRRFVNQIQYGCKSPLCDVPTCLSYRRRNAVGPFRPLKDAVARTLAWQCVEHYANNSQDIRATRDTTRPPGQRSKGHAGKPYRGDGLCWNEPVVPWYQCPDGPTRSRSPSRRGARAYQLFGEVNKPVSSIIDRVPIAINSRSTASQELRNDHKNAKEQTSHGLPRAPSEERVQPVPRFDEASLTQTLFTTERVLDSFLKSTSDAEPNVSRPSAQSAQSGTTNGLSTQEQSSDQDGTADDQILAKDTSKSIATGDDLQVPISLPAGSEANAKDRQPTLDKQSTPEASTKDRDAEKLGRVSTGLKPPDTAQSHDDSKRPFTTSFFLLPTSAVLWLTDTFAARFTSQERSTEEIHRFSSFVQQSIYLCFSHPLRLISSASTWDNYFDAMRDGPDNIENLTLEEIYQQKLEQYEKAFARDDVILKDRTAVPLPQRGSIFAVVTELLRVVPTGGGLEAIIDFLFSALQHAYVLPDWAHTRQKYSPPKAESPSFGSTSYLPNELIAHLFLLITNMLVGFAKYVGETPETYTLRDTKDMQDLTLQAYVFARGTGQVYHERTFMRIFKDVHDEEWRRFLRGYLANIYWQHDNHVLRVITAMADIISHRLALSGAAKSMNPPRRMTGILDCIAYMLEHPPHLKPAPWNKEISYSTAVRVFEIMQTVFMAKWNRKAVISRRGPVAGALAMISTIYHKRYGLGLTGLDFEMPFVSAQFDSIEMPFQWISFSETPTQIHILQFPFLFSDTTLAKYFRAINLQLMQREHEKAMQLYHNADAHMIRSRWQVFGVREVLQRTRAHMAKFFVMTIRRDRVLEDAIEQIWQREKQELMRPLKVRLGKDEGEDGLDHGGVQQEFFRLAFAQAFDPQHGMFTVDETTRMTWFKPGSLEPLYRFEALGILLALALYNAVTIPVTLPLAFYRMLLGLPVTSLAHIEDGWPDLCKSFQMMLEWEDGDVKDIMARTYEFSYESYGEVVNVDISKPDFVYPWTKTNPVETATQSAQGTTNGATSPPEMCSPTAFSTPSTPSIADEPHLVPLPNQLSPNSDSSFPKHFYSRSNSVSSSVSKVSTSPSLDSSSEAPLVTNTNRQLYVSAYIAHLTHHSVAPQIKAFLDGFHRSTSLMSPHALSLFTPETLQTLTEGEHTPVNVDELEATATYDEYDERDEYIKWFWEIVRGWHAEGDAGEEKVRKLLEFVTSSSRVPVGGLGGVTFIVQRNGTGGDENIDGELGEGDGQVTEIVPNGIVAGSQAAQVAAETATGSMEQYASASASASATQERSVITARLPSSSTCYGRLLLPQYKTKEILKERLEKAIENSIGFGSL